MKVALLTANIGDFDEVLSVPNQSVPYDYFLYTENNLPVPLSEQNNRMKSKFIKFQPHKFLPGYDVFIWVDGRVQINTGTFVEDCLKQLSNNDIVISRHPERETTGQEYDFIIEWQRKGNKYLLSRYDQDAIIAERKIVGDDTELMAGYFFVWRNNELNKKIFNSIWNFLINYNSFDQCFLSYQSKYMNRVIYQPDITLLKHK